MDASELSYYTFNQTLLTLIGLWPYRVTTITYIQRLVFIGILLSGIIFQLTSLTTNECSLEFLLEVMSSTMLTIIYCFKYICFIIFNADMKEILDQIKNDEKLLQTDSEVEVMRECANQGKQLLAIFSLVCFPSAFVYVLTQFLPMFLDIVAPKDQPRPREPLVPIEIFVDQGKYHYFIIFSTSLVITVGITTLVSTEGLFLMCVQHACGMFRITSDRLQRAADERVLRIPCPLRNVVVSKNIIDAIVIHKSVIRFCDLMKSKFLPTYILLMSLGVISLSINLYRLSREVQVLNDMQQLMLIMSFVNAHFFYAFAVNFVGQRLINYSGSVFHKIYDSQWYLIPVPSQKLILFLLRKCMEVSTVSLCGIYSTSLEGFSSMVNVSLSYFMIIYSVQVDD